MTMEERDMVMRLATERGLTMADYVRQLIRREHHKPKETRDQEPFC